MLYNILLVLLFIDAALLVTVILLQAGKGGGLAATFGGVSSSADAIFGTRAAGNLLTKASWWCGALFLGLAFVLSLMSTRTRRPTSVLDEAFTPPPAAAPTPRQAAPALPLEEATPPGGGAKSPTPGAEIGRAAVYDDRHGSLEDDTHLAVRMRVRRVDGAGIVRPLGHGETFVLQRGDERTAIDVAHGLVR
jgi:preprotein translocase subunit SecG